MIAISLAPRGARRLSVVAAILLCAALIGPSVLGQIKGAIGKGALVKPVAALPLQESPPQGYFSFKGPEVGTTTPAKAYTVIDTKTVPTLFGQDTWLLVQDKSDPKKMGWLYTGSDGKPYQNVNK